MSSRKFVLIICQHTKQQERTHEELFSISQFSFFISNDPSIVSQSSIFNLIKESLSTPNQNKTNGMFLAGPIRYTREFSVLAI